MSAEQRIVRIAVASDDDRGLAADVSPHFGRCPAYTLAEVRGDEIRSHRVVANPHFAEHVRGAVPQFLSGLDADVVLAGGMGPRAVAMFRDLGIEVATGIGDTVAEAIDAWLGGARGTKPCRHDHPRSCGGHHD
ncbi:MAG: NifB/NifX family molybdenum-iron cluster-binding protein [Planctomycetota bacterium]|jgi:predicted Fe-Mo cluster-binding NifX family protein